MKANLVITAEPEFVAPATEAVAPRASGWLRRRPSLEKAALSIGDQAIYSGTSFVTAVIVGRSTSQSELGIYYLTLTIVMVLYGIHDNVISGPYLIHSARKTGRELAEFTGSMWVHHLGLTLVGMLAIVAMMVVAGMRGSVDFTAGLWTLLVAGPLMLLREGIRRLSFVRLRLISAIAVDITVSALQLGGLLALWYFQRMSVPGIFAVMGGACALASLGWYFFTDESPRFTRDRVAADWRHNWGFGRWAVLSWLTVDTVPFAMPWIVDFAAGTAATGLYGGCGTLVGVTNILVVGTGNFLRPKAAQSFADGGPKALRSVLLVTGGLFALVFGVFSISMIFAGDWLGALVYGQSFRGAWPILAALAATVMLNSLGFTAASGLWAIGRPRASLVADISQMLATMIAAFALVPTHGALGAALAALVGSVVGTIAKVTTLHCLLESLSGHETAHASAHSTVLESTSA